ncbi:MAG: site-2 protease family protein [Nitriliruptorales bacterium]
MGHHPGSAQEGPSIFGRSLRIGAVRGIDIKIDASWTILALIVAWSFWAWFGDAGFGTSTTLVMAVVSTLLFFTSVLVHELAHSLEAQHRGVEVGGITLFVFGGVTETRFDVRRPRDEFALTAVGPFSSLVLAALFGLLATYADAAGLDTVAQVSGVLGWINLMLAVFNLLPGAPLDGGRILRSIVWALTKDRAKAVRFAGRAGQLLGSLLVALGMFEVLFVPAGFAQGLWLAIIGWFLAGTAGAELRQQELEAAVGQRPIERFTADLPPPVPEYSTVAEVEDLLTRGGHEVLPVSRNGEVVGVVSDDAIADVPTAERPLRTVAGVTRPLSDIPDAERGDGVVDVLHRLRGEQLVAVRNEAGELLGIVTREQLGRAIQRARAMQPARRRRGRRRTGHLPGEGG